MSRDLLLGFAPALRHLVPFVAADAPSAGQSSGVVIAIIGAAGIVLAATVPVLIARRSRAIEPHPLNSNTATGAPHSSALAERVEVFERFCWRNHIDPTLIETGEESVADVHFD